MVLQRNLSLSKPLTLLSSLFSDLYGIVPLLYYSSLSMLLHCRVVAVPCGLLHHRVLVPPTGILTYRYVVPPSGFCYFRIVAPKSEFLHHVVHQLEHPFLTLQIRKNLNHLPNQSSRWPLLALLIEREAVVELPSSNYHIFTSSTLRIECVPPSLYHGEELRVEWRLHYSLLLRSNNLVSYVKIDLLCSYCVSQYISFFHCFFW